VRINNVLAITSITVALIIMVTSPVLGQANANKGVIHIGGSFNQPFVDDADSGFFGLDIFTGKMVTNELCIGIRSGYDIVSYQKYTNGVNKQLGVIPLQIRARYYHSFSVMLQTYGSLGAGVFRTQNGLGGLEVGSIKSAANCPGGSISIGLDYWYLLTTGIGFELEYNLFKVPDGGDMFSYLSARVAFCKIGF
jgi:hypothetical protein